MNRLELVAAIADNVRKKHPWKISQEKYQKFFRELPREFLNERLAWDNLLAKSKGFKVCSLFLCEVRVEVQLTLDECVAWEIGRWEDAAFHNVTPTDVKKALKPRDQ